MHILNFQAFFEVFREVLQIFLQAPIYEIWHTKYVQKLCNDSINTRSNYLMPKRNSWLFVFLSLVHERAQNVREVLRAESGHLLLHRERLEGKHEFRIPLLTVDHKTFRRLPCSSAISRARLYESSDLPQKKRKINFRRFLRVGQYRACGCALAALWDGVWHLLSAHTIDLAPQTARYRRIREISKLTDRSTSGLRFDHFSTTLSEMQVSLVQNECKSRFNRVIKSNSNRNSK